jgi:hypothetical protein
MQQCVEFDVTDDLSAHTPMMQQYRRMTFLQTIFVGSAPKPSKKSVLQSPSSAQ